ncbi:MAG: hypothetical protein IJ708_08905 [Clostridia bacterium]|nr:hypothetical protein [Clostridia bacterium]
MAFTVYQTNKKTGTVYAYEQETYRDPETKKNKVRRTYLGRVDPETKCIIEKAESGKRNRTSVEAAEKEIMIPNEVYALIEEQRKQIQALSDKLDSVCRALEERDHILFQIKDAIALSPKAKK